MMHIRVHRTRPFAMLCMLGTAVSLLVCASAALNPPGGGPPGSAGPTAPPEAAKFKPGYLTLNISDQFLPQARPTLGTYVGDDLALLFIDFIMHDRDQVPGTAPPQFVTDCTHAVWNCSDSWASSTMFRVIGELGNPLVYQFTANWYAPGQHRVQVDAWLDPGNIIECYVYDLPGPTANVEGMVEYDSAGHTMIINPDGGFWWRIIAADCPP